MFDSLISIPSRPFNTTIWRVINPATLPNGQFDAEICYNTEMIPDIVDIMGKGRYFYNSFTDQQIQLSMTVREFASFMPSLLNSYSESTPINIGCRPDISEMVVDIKTADGSKMLQWPMRCVYVVSTTGEEFMSVLGEFRMSYVPQSNGQQLTGVVLSVSVHNLKPSNKFPIMGLSSLSEVMNRIGQTFKGMDLLSPGNIQVTLQNMFKYTAGDAGINGDAFCFKYLYSSSVEN